eukprot:6178720-Pleurochrysis_carterae.AAC.4
MSVARRTCAPGRSSIRSHHTSWHRHRQPGSRALEAANILHAIRRVPAAPLRRLECEAGTAATKLQLTLGLLVGSQLRHRSLVGTACMPSACLRFQIHDQKLVDSSPTSQSQSKAELLSEAASNGGLYTTARTVCAQSRVLLLNDHALRLQLSRDAVRTMMWTAVDAFGRVTATASAATDFLASSPNETAVAKQVELQITCAVWHSESTHIAGVFVQPLPPLPPAPRKIHCVPVPTNCGRDNARLKDAAWVRKRESIVVHEKDVCETAMLDEHGGVTEGVSSNIAFLRRSDGAIVTAPDSLVLSGTIRRVLLEVCAEENVPVVFECPNPAKNPDTYVGCFVLSTSRLALTIDELVIHVMDKNMPPVSVLYDVHERSANGSGLSASALSQLVEKGITNRSDRLLPP